MTVINESVFALHAFVVNYQKKNPTLTDQILPASL